MVYASSIINSFIRVIFFFFINIISEESEIDLSIFRYYSRSLKIKFRNDDARWNKILNYKILYAPYYPVLL